ncbi:hypothetical protein L6232_25955, partial [Shewanella sp. C31]|nr:hypothetical protein [Shewanella electrica]
MAKRKAEQQRRTLPAAEEWLPALPEQTEFSYEVQEFESNMPELAEQAKGPTFRKEVFFFKVLCAASLVLGAGIVFKSNNP